MDAQVETPLGKSRKANCVLVEALNRNVDGVVSWDKLSLSGKDLLEMLGVLAGPMRKLEAL